MELIEGVTILYHHITPHSPTAEYRPVLYHATLFPINITATQGACWVDYLV